MPRGDYRIRLGFLMIHAKKSREQKLTPTPDEEETAAGVAEDS